MGEERVGSDLGDWIHKFYFSCYFSEEHIKYVSLVNRTLHDLGLVVPVLLSNLRANLLAVSIDKTKADIIKTNSVASEFGCFSKDHENLVEP